MSGQSEKVPAPDHSFTQEEKDLILSVRRQCEAKAAAELKLGVNVRPKIIGGRCCLFSGVTRTTPYTGHTWAGAVARLIYLLKTATPEGEPLKKEISATQPAVVALGTSSRG